MVPNVNARGTSFAGVTAYLMHDKEKAQTSERMAWSSTRNMITDDIEMAAKIMAFTDMHSEDIKRDFGGSAAGTKREAGAVYHFSLSESPENNPSQEEWENIVDSNIKILGLEDHQYYMVSHNDEPHAHVHVVVNLVHPQSGKINTLHNDYKKMDKWAHDYELEHGIVCKERDKKYKAWEQENKAFREKERRTEYAEKVTSAFEQSDNSQSFKAALEYEGLTLSQGNRRGFVLVDGQGEIYALNRLINFDDDLKRKEKNQQIKEKLKGIDRDSLPVADKLQEKRQHIDRDAVEVEQQNKLLDAAEKAAQSKIYSEQEALKQQERIEQIFKQKRIEILTQAKHDWQSIKSRHKTENIELEQKLRDTDSREEKAHRDRWNAIINQENIRKTEVEEQLGSKGVKGVLFRLRHGKEAREEIDALNKNIENANSRLNEGVGGLSSNDKFILANQRKTHYEQQKALRMRIDEELKQAREKSQEEAKKSINGDTQMAGKKDKDPLDDLRNVAKNTADKNSERAKQQNIPLEELLANDEENRQEEQYKKSAARQAKLQIDPLSYWESVGIVKDAKDEIERAKQQNISVEKLRELDEEIRQAAVHPEKENVKVETQVNIEKDFSQSAASEQQEEQNQANSDWYSEKAAVNDNQQGAEQLNESYEAWEEIQEIFAERHEEIENNMDYTQEERQQALAELEEQYYEAQSEYDYQYEQEQDQGIER